MIIAGIDEAGLGPVLGPMVVSATAFEVDAPEAVDLWELLRGAVLRKKSKRPGSAVVIGDSKKLYDRSRSDGLVPLERAVLAMLVNLPQFEGEMPSTLAELMEGVSSVPASVADEYPWYNTRQFGLPFQDNSISVKLAGNALKIAFRNSGVYFLGARVEPLFVHQYNRYIAATNNKSTTAFDCTCRGLMWLWQSFAGQDMDVMVDHQGGRVHYREPLQRIFPDATLKIISEDEKLSSYMIDHGERKMKVSFAVGGEEKCLATALSSMMSKYVRELFMSQLNAFWAGKLEGLESTAGYYVDGKRFYEQIKPLLAELGINEDWLLRSR